MNVASPMVHLGRVFAFVFVLAAACGEESKDSDAPAAGTSGAGDAGSAGGRAGSAGSSSEAGSAGSGGSAAGIGGTTGGAPIAGSSGSGASGGGGSDAAGGGGKASGGSAGTAGLGGTGGSVSGGAGTDGGAAGAGGGDLGPPVPADFAIEAVLASDLEDTAPTTVGIVTWTLDKPGITEAHIDFGLDAAYGMTAPVDLTEPDHRTVLVGMKPAKTYHYRIVATDGAAAYTSGDRTLATGAPFSDLPIMSFSVESASALDKGFFIGSFWSLFQDEPPWTVFIMDTDGDIVWWYTEPDPVLYGEEGFARARLSADSHDVWLAQARNGAAPLKRVSIDTLEVQTYPNTVASHDICAVSGDKMAYLDYGETDCDSIFEIDKAGTVREVFEPTGVIDMTSGCHGNSVRYSKKEDVYVYSDKQNDVVVVGRDGTLKWALSERVSGGNASWGGSQHGAQLLDESLLIFANSAGGDQNSQALEFGLDGSLLRSFTSRGTGDFFGDVQRMPNGGTLIDYSTIGLMQVVDSTDAVVLQIQASLSFGYFEFRESLYGLPLDIQQ